TPISPNCSRILGLENYPNRAERMPTDPDGATGLRKWKDGWRRLARHFPVPSIGVPGFLGLAKQRDESVGIFTLDVVTAIIKNIDHGVVIQSENGAGIEGKSMLKGDFYAGLCQYFFGLLDGHSGLKTKYRPRKLCCQLPHGTQEQSEN